MSRPGTPQQTEAAGPQPGMEEVVARMRDLATNRGDEPHRRSRRDRAQLRGVFRSLCSAVEVRTHVCRVAWPRRMCRKSCGAKLQSSVGCSVAMHSPASGAAVSFEITHYTRRGFLRGWRAVHLYS